jgi:hypothetical protein
MRSLKHEIRRMILEQVDELFADEEKDVSSARDSVDDQIDSFIIKFENDSIDKEAEEDNMSRSLSEMSLRALLAEQDAPDAPPDEEDEEEDKPPAEEPDATDADVELDDPEPAKTPMLPLDVSAFIGRVARLALNSETLLDVKTTVVNRALSFLRDNYDDSHVRDAIEILDSQFDFDIEGEKEAPIAPEAVGAWAGGTGGLGGGGGAV